MNTENKPTKIEPWVIVSIICAVLVPVTNAIAMRLERIGYISEQTYFTFSHIWFNPLLWSFIFVVGIITAIIAIKKIRHNTRLRGKTIAIMGFIFNLSFLCITIRVLIRINT